MVPTQFLANVIGGWGMLELLVVGLIGLLLFGRRLPEVGHSLGRGIVEFKRGLAGMEDQLLAGPHSEAPAAPPQLPAPAAAVAVSPPDLAAHRAKVVWACFLIGIFITPSQDLVSNVLFPLLLWGLFELGLLTARLVLPAKPPRYRATPGPCTYG